MADKALKGINGVPRMTSIASVDSIYDQTLIVNASGIAINDIITLPSSGTYESKDLKVYVDGVFMEPTLDYDYVGTGVRTQIEMLRPLGENARIRFVVEGFANSIYDVVIVVPNGGYAPNTTITLPNSQTYQDAELEVYLDGIRIEVGLDYTYVGLPDSTRTQITIIPELFENERLRLRIG